MTDRERRLHRALVRIAAAIDILTPAAWDLPNCDQALGRTLEARVKSLLWIAGKVRRELEGGGRTP